jgi:hypothetical protein
MMIAYEEGERRIEQLNNNSISYKTFDEVIESLPQKSWEVELEMETIHADRALNGWETLPKFVDGKIKILKIL